MNVKSHEEVWVKVNASVDRGIAPVVALLNEIDGLQTLDSCQGTPGEKPAHVYFHYGDWKCIGHFVFEVLAPKLALEASDIGTASVEVFNGSIPMGKLSFEPEATEVVASVLNVIVHERAGSRSKWLM